MKKTVYYLFSVLALANMNAGCGGGLFSSPSQTVKTYLHHLEKGELDAAVKLNSTRLVNDAKSAAAGRSELYGQPSLLGSLGGIKSIDFENESVQGEAAVVTATINFNKGAVIKRTYFLIKENEGWKIDNTRLDYVNDPNESK